MEVYLVYDNCDYYDTEDLPNEKLVAIFTTLEDAVKMARSGDNSLQPAGILVQQRSDLWEINSYVIVSRVVSQSVEEYREKQKDAIRANALSKLTAIERAALGF